jgi:hypothetical protein
MPGRTIQELEAELVTLRQQDQQHVIGNSVLSPDEKEAKLSRAIFPNEVPLVEKYAVTAWGETEFDFTTPSGQLCRLRKADVAELAEKGILDQVTRLPGVTAGVIATAEGQPPQKADAMPDRETIKTVINLVNVLVPMVVVAPEICPLPEPLADGSPGPREEGLIYVDSIEITDRIAIMTRVLGGLQKMDAFRVES